METDDVVARLDRLEGVVGNVLTIVEKMFDVQKSSPEMPKGLRDIIEDNIEEARHTQAHGA